MPDQRSTADLTFIVVLPGGILGNIAFFALIIPSIIFSQVDLIPFNQTLNQYLHPSPVTILTGSNKIVIPDI